MALDDAFRRYQGYLDNYQQTLAAHPQSTQQNAYDYQLLDRYAKPGVTLGHVRNELGFGSDATDEAIFMHIRERFKNYDDEQFEKTFGHLRPQTIAPPQAVAPTPTVAPEEEKKTNLFGGLGAFNKVKGHIAGIGGQVGASMRNAIQRGIPASFKQIAENPEYQRKVIGEIDAFVKQNNPNDEQLKAFLKQRHVDVFLGENKDLPQLQYQRENVERRFDEEWKGKTGAEIVQALTQKTVKAEVEVEQKWDRYHSKKEEMRPKTESVWNPYAMADALGDSFGRMLPGLAVAAVPGVGPALGAMYIGADVYGHAMKDGKDRGLSYDESHERALFQALTEGATESVPLGLFWKAGKIAKGTAKGAAQVATKETITKETTGMIKSLWKSPYMRHIAKSAGAEGMQEITVESLNALYDKLKDYEERSLGEFLHDVAYAGTIGAIMGAGIGGALGARPVKGAAQRGWEERNLKQIEYQGTPMLPPPATPEQAPPQTDMDTGLGTIPVEPEGSQATRVGHKTNDWLDAFRLQIVKASETIAVAAGFQNNTVLFDKEGSITGRITREEDGYKLFDNQGELQAETASLTDARNKAEELFGLEVSPHMTEPEKTKNQYQIVKNMEENTYHVYSPRGRLVADNLPNVEAADAVVVEAQDVFSQNALLMDAEGLMQGRIALVDDQFVLYDNKGNDIAEGSSYEDIMFEAEESFGMRLEPQSTEKVQEQDGYTVLQNRQSGQFSVIRDDSGRFVRVNETREGIEDFLSRSGQDIAPETINVDGAVVKEVALDASPELLPIAQNENHADRFYEVESKGKKLGFIVRNKWQNDEVSYGAFTAEGQIGRVVDFDTIEEAVNLLTPKTKPEKTEVADPVADNWAVDPERSTVARDAQNQVIKDIRTFENGSFIEIVPSIKTVKAQKTDPDIEVSGETGVQIFRVFRGKENVKGKEQVATFDTYEKAVDFRDKFTDKQQKKFKTTTKAKTPIQISQRVGNQLAETEDLTVPYGEAQTGRFGNYVVEGRSAADTGDVYFEVTDPGARGVQKRGTVTGKSVGHVTVDKTADKFIARTGGFRAPGSQNLGEFDTVEDAQNAIVEHQESTVVEQGYQVRQDPESEQWVVEDPVGNIVDEYASEAQAETSAQEYNEQQRTQSATYESIEIQKDDARLRQELEDQGLTGAELDAEIAEQSAWTDYRVMNAQTNQVIGEVSKTADGEFIAEPKHDFDALEGQTFDSLESAQEAVAESYRGFVDKRISERHSKQVEQDAQTEVRREDYERTEKTLERLREKQANLQDERAQKLIETLKGLDETREAPAPIDVTQSLLETDPKRIKVTPKQRLRLIDGVRAITTDHLSIRRSLIEDHNGNPAFEFGKKLAEQNNWQTEGQRIVDSMGETVTDKHIQEAVATEHLLGNAIMFSKNTTRKSRVKGATKAEVEALIEELNISPEFAENITIIEKEEDLPIEFATNVFMSESVSGWIVPGENKVYLNLIHPRSLKHVEKLLAHELIGHLGFDAIVGKKNYDWFVREYRKLKADNSAEFQEIHAELRRRYPIEGDEHLEITEFVALASERRGWQSKKGVSWQKIQYWFRRLVASVMEWLRGKSGMHKNFTDRFTMNDVYDILAMSEKSLRGEINIRPTESTDSLADLGAFGEAAYGRKISQNELLQTETGFNKQSKTVQEALRSLVRQTGLGVQLDGMSWDQLQQQVFLRVLNANHSSNQSARIRHTEDPRGLNVDLSKLGDELSHRGIAGISDNGFNLIFNGFHTSNLKPKLRITHDARRIGKNPILEAEAELVPEVHLHKDHSYKMVPREQVTTKTPKNSDRYLFHGITPVDGREISAELKRIVRKIGYELQQPDLTQHLGTAREPEIMDAIWEYFGEANGRRFLKEMGLQGTVRTNYDGKPEYTTYPTESVQGAELVQAMLTARTESFAQFSQDIGKDNPLSPRQKKSWKEWNNNWQWMRKWFTRGGRIPDEIYQHEYKEKVGEDLLGHIMPDYLLQELRAHVAPYKTWAQVPQSMHTKILKALTGDIPLSQVSENKKVQETLRHIRTSIDQQTTRNIQTLANSIMVLKLRAVETLQRPTSKNLELAAKIEKHIEEHTNLLETLKSNKGTYLHRAYQAHNNPAWVKKVHEGKFRKSHFDPAADELREFYINVWREDTGSTETPPTDITEKAEHFGRNYAASILFKSQNYDFVDAKVVSAMGEETQDGIALKALSLYRQRKNITPGVRKMLGEYTDARAVIANTINKQATLAAGMDFQVKLFNNYLGKKLLYEQPDENSDAYTQYIQIDDKSTTKLLRGMWIDRDIVEGIQENEEIKASWITTAAGITKIGLTAYSFSTQARNIIANPWFLLQAGINPLHIFGRYMFGKDAVFLPALKAIVMSKVDPKFRERYKIYNRFGIVGDSVAGGQFHEIRKSINLNPQKDALIGVLEQTLRMFKVKDQTIERWIETLKQGGRVGLDIFQRMYAFGDEAFKIMAFEEVLRTQVPLRKELDTEEKKFRFAADFVNDNMMNYSTVPKSVKRLSVTPLTASFPTFTAEFYRTSKNNMKDIIIKSQGLDATRKDTYATVMRKLFSKERVKDKERRSLMRKEGYKHFALFATPYLILGLGIDAAMRAIWGIFGDLEEYDEMIDAYQDIAPGWARFAKPVIWPGGYNKEKHTIDYWNVSSLIPQYYFLKPFAIFDQVGNTLTLEEAIAYSRQELSKPFTDLDITMQAVLEVLLGVDKDTKQPIFSPVDDWWESAGKGASHILSATQPGTVRSAVNIFRAATGEIRRSGQEYSVEGEIGAMLGYRTTRLNLVDSLYFSARDMKRVESAAVASFNETIYPKAVQENPQLVSNQKIKNAYDRTQEFLRINFNRQQGVTDAALALEIPFDTIISQYQHAGVSKKDAYALLNNYGKKFMPSKESLARKLKNAPPQYINVYNESYWKSVEYAYSGEISTTK